MIVLSVLVPSKHQSMVFYSSALEGALVHKNWSSVPLVAFLAKKINKEQQLPQKFFLETPLQW